MQFTCIVLVVYYFLVHRIHWAPDTTEANYNKHMHCCLQVHLEQFFHQLILEYQYRPTQLTTLEQKTLITIGINV